MFKFEGRFQYEAQTQGAETMASSSENIKYYYSSRLGLQEQTREIISFDAQYDGIPITSAPSSGSSQIPPIISGLHHNQPSLHHHCQNSTNGAVTTNSIGFRGMGYSNATTSSNRLASHTGMNHSGGLDASNSIPSHTLGSFDNLGTPTTMCPSSNMSTATVVNPTDIPPNETGSYKLAYPEGGIPMRPMHQVPFQSYECYCSLVLPLESPISNMHQLGCHLAPPHQLHGLNMRHPYGNQQMACHTQSQPMQPPPIERSFKCDQCARCFRRNHDLKRHKRIHLSIKPFPCGNCSKSFSRKDALKRHRLAKSCNGGRNRDGWDATKSQGNISGKNNKDYTPWIDDADAHRVTTGAHVDSENKGQEVCASK